MSRVFIICEAGSNHDGDLDRAKRLVDVAVAAGGDAVKFQLIPPFKPEWIDELITHCGDRIEFMATPFNQAGIEALKGKVKRWKIAATEGADLDFVDAVVHAANGQPIYLSDGAVEYPVEAENITPLACVVKYPAKEEDYHFLKGKWGLSDHTENLILGPLAVAAGASVVEKHFTDDKGRSGPDHGYALSPGELRDYIRMIRFTEQIKQNKKQTITTYVGRKLQWPIQ